MPATESPKKPLSKPVRAHVNSTRTDREVMKGAQLNAHHLITGITHDLHGAKHMAAVLAVVPPGAPTRVHMHPSSETILFMIEGWGATLVGPELELVIHGPGDFAFIPEGTIHIGFNLSRTHRVVLTETRSHKHFNQDVQLQPDLEERALAKIKEIQDKFADGTLEMPADWREHIGKPYDFK